MRARRQICGVGRARFPQSTLGPAGPVAFLGAQPALSGLPRKSLPGHAALNSGLGSRQVGTQTPEFRIRQEGLLRGTKLPLRYADGLKGTNSPASEVADLVAAAHVAAAAGESKRCLEVVWAMRDSPHRREVLRAAEMPRGKPPRTLLQAAAAGGFDGVADHLLELGVAPHAKDAEGTTALHLAAQGNHAEVARLLLARGRANPNARDVAGRTPLHLASELGHSRTCRVLMRFCAKATVPNAAMETSLAVAGKSSDAKLGPWLEQYAKKQERSSAIAGKIQYFEALGSKLPAHVVAPELRLTATGYCPVNPDGKLKQLPRGIRQTKSRRAPSSPKCRVNWYSPRG